MAEDNIRKNRDERKAGEPVPLAARGLVRRSLAASLATLDSTSGHPYASLVTTATAPNGAPLLLLSRLALHTRNIESDKRASILFQETRVEGDPLAEGRVTLIGRLERTENPLSRARFLARNEHAQIYADFPDFAFYEMSVERAHFIGGFGRIVELEPRDLVIDVSDAADLIAAEAEIVSHMNEDHAAAIALYATQFCGAPSGAWRMTGIDPEGCDVVCGGGAGRVLFAERVRSPGDARRELARLAAEARALAAKT